MYKELRILSINVSEIPCENQCENLYKTFHLLKSQKDVDIICVQGLYDNKYKQYLSDILNEYPYKINTAKYNLPGVLEYLNLLEDSGLFIASIYPINWWEFHPYKNIKSSAWKGVIGACISLPSDKTIMLFNTQLHKDKSKDSVVKDQIKYLVKYIEQQTFDCGILVGDFCIDENNFKDYQYLTYNVSLMTSQGHDIYRTMYPNFKEYPGYTVDGIKNKMINNLYRKRSDYIFALNLSPENFKTINIWNPEYSSYHYGLITKLIIEESKVIKKMNKEKFGIWPFKRLLYFFINY